MGLHLSGGSGGGAATTDASALISGTLAIARIANGSVTDAKLASGASGAKPLTRTGVKTANYTAAMWDLVPCDTSGGAFTVTLPAASGGKGRVALKLVTAGNTLTVALTGSDHINTSTGPTTGSLSLANQGMILESDGSGIWTITADDLALTQLDARYDAAGAAAAKATALTPTATKTSAYTAVDGDAVLADATSAGFTVTLPAATAKRIVAVRKVDSSANAVTVAPTSGTIDGSATRTLVNQWQTQTYIADGTNWHRMTVPGVTGIAATGTPSSTTYLRGDGSWSTPAGGGAVATDVIFDAKGDLPVGTGADTAAKLTVGTNGYALVADSTQATGLAWTPRTRVADEAHADTTVVNTTTETDMATLAIPTSVAVGDLIRVSIWADQLNNSGAGVNYTYRIKVGATTVLDSGTNSVSANASRTKIMVTADILVESTSAQRARASLFGTRGATSWASGTSVPGSPLIGYGTAAEDLTAGKNVKFTVQMGTAASTADFVLHGATLEVIKKA